MLSLLPRPPNRLHQIALSDTLSARIVPGCDLRVDLDTAVGRDEVFGDVVALVNRDAGVDDGVVFPGGDVSVHARGWMKGNAAREDEEGGAANRCGELRLSRDGRSTANARR